MIFYPITPTPKPRMTQRDSARSLQNRIQGMRPVVARYFAFCQEVQLRKVDIPESGAHIIFVIPMPKSWSNKKKLEMEGMPHQSRPDVDNLLKSILDAVHKEDCSVWDIRATKAWGMSGEIRIGKID